MTQVPASSHGSVSPTAQTATVTTSPTTFVVEHVFDLSRVSAVLLVTTITALVPDGEVFDNTHLGLTNQGLDGLGPMYDSLDGVAYVALGSSSAELSHAFTVGSVGYASIVSARFIKAAVTIVEANGFAYAGANHPTATVRFDVSFV